jgi:hypothetical protein
MMGRHPADPIIVLSRNSAKYSRYVNTSRPLDEVLEAAFPWRREHQDAIAKVFGAYSERKTSRWTCVGSGC